METTRPGRWNFTPPVPLRSWALFHWPVDTGAALRFWLRGWRLTTPRIVMLALAFVLWRWASPSPETAATLAPGWIIQLWLRNLAVVAVVAGGTHLYLHTFRRQGDEFRYDARPLGRNKRIFLFSDQVRDNAFLTLGPAVICWTVWEAFMWWAYANGWATLITWSSNPVWFVVLLLIVPLWSSLYFSVQHWLLHRRPVYRHVHAWHHRNVNIGPLSGLAMHPAEQFLLFSDVVLFLLVPSHPIHLLFAMLHHGVGAPLSHTGYDAIRLPLGLRLNVGDFHHQLHHRLIECNYGGLDSPLDDLIDSFHDGTSEGDRHIAERRKRLSAGARA